MISVVASSRATNRGFASWRNLPDRTASIGGSRVRTGLRRISPQIGNFRGQGRRLLAISPQRLRDRESGDKVERAKTKDFRACETQVVNLGRTQDFLAGDAVLIVPVSGANSLKTGNFTGNLLILAPLRQETWQKTAAVQYFFTQFPALNNREFHSTNRVLSPTEQGICESAVPPGFRNQSFRIQHASVFERIDVGVRRGLNLQRFACKSPVLCLAGMDGS